MINIEIDGIQRAVEPGSMIIEADDTIPRFCYHKKLSIAANCRMCLVEVDKSRKPVPACATPVTEGMKIFTRSPMALDAQRSVMEFLLINHPLDCPICDQGGECELQDVSMGYGEGISRFSEGKRSINDENLGSLIATEMTRCILCTRCVRFGEEIAGMRELGVMGRGEHSEIETFINKNMNSELSGNVIDVCPVGALTSRPYRFTARAWELVEHPNIAPHDCINSNIYIHERRKEVMRVVPKENEGVNEVWLSDRDRFSYTSLYSHKRASEPKIKKEGQWQSVSWEEALEFAVNGLSRVINSHSSQQIGALISPSATTEELYLWQKLWRKLNVQNIDHRLRETDTSAQSLMPLYPGLTCTLTEVENQEAFLLIGANPRKEQPLLSQRIRKATFEKRTKVYALNAVDYDFNFDVSEKIIKLPHEWSQELEGIVSAVLQKIPEETLKQHVQTDKKNDAKSDEKNKWFLKLKDRQTNLIQEQIAVELLKASSKLILLGGPAIHSPYYGSLLGLCELLAQLTKANIGLLTDGANSAGAWFTGAVPHRFGNQQHASNHIGLSAFEQFEQPLKGYALFQCEPELDAIHSAKAKASLLQAEFVVSFSVFEGEGMMEYSHVILPLCSFAENEGSYINLTGLSQSFHTATPPQFHRKLGWKVLRVLGNGFGLDGFEYKKIEDVQSEIEHEVGSPKLLTLNDFIHFDPSLLPAVAQKPEDALWCLPEWAIYNVDAYVRNSEPLQKAASQDLCEIKMHPLTANRLGIDDQEQVTVEQNGYRMTLPLKLSEHIVEDGFWLPLGYVATQKVWDAYAPFHVVRDALYNH